MQQNAGVDTSVDDEPDKLRTTRDVMTAWMAVAVL
jgi:hypothetical protein